MSKLGQLVLPVALFAFVGAAQAATEQTVTFGPSGSGFFDLTSTTALYQIQEFEYVVGAPGSDAAGYQSMAAATGNAWMATNRYETSPVFFNSTSGLFDLGNVWFADPYGTQTLTVTGFLNGVQTGVTTVGISTTAAQFSFAGITGFQGIDSFSIATGTDFVVTDPVAGTAFPGVYWAMGSATVTPTTAVPEPETYAMLLAGLALVGAVARRRRMV